MVNKDMGIETFINTAFSTSIENYLYTKDEPLSSSLAMNVIIIRTLIAIYGELAIINPYLNKNITKKNGFDYNLMKYGFAEEKLNDFKNCFQSFFDTLQEKDNIFLVKVEKYLMEMLFLKKKCVGISSEELESLKYYFCLADNDLLKDYTSFYILDKRELDYYFAKQNYESEHAFDLKPVQKVVLFTDAYLLCGYTLDEIAKMTSDEIELANQHVYEFFKIPKEESNKRDLLIDAVNYYKRYKNRLTSGNGFVDLLLISSIISTILLVLFIITIKIS